MNINDFKRLKKLMNMTLSGADQEKLTAINSANEIVLRAGTTWDRILDRVIKVEVEIESRAEPSANPNDVAARRAVFAKKIDDAFAAIEASDPRGDAADFIASLKDQWERNGRLSSNQLEALWKFEKNARARMATR